MFLFNRLINQQSTYKYNEWMDEHSAREKHLRRIAHNPVVLEHCPNQDTNLANVRRTDRSRLDSLGRQRSKVDKERLRDLQRQNITVFAGMSQVAALGKYNSELEHEEAKSEQPAGNMDLMSFNSDSTNTKMFADLSKISAAYMQDRREFTDLRDSIKRREQLIKGIVEDRLDTRTNKGRSRGGSRSHMRNDYSKMIMGENLNEFSMRIRESSHRNERGL